MQFVVDGPDIPEEFLFAHERGDVVFFCGAGISKGAGLPDFKQLVTGVYSDFDRTLDVRRSNDCTWTESCAYKRGNYDVVLHLLERMQTRAAVRECVRKRLTVKSRQSEIHKALLRLAKTNTSGGMERQLHLVTTNYDGCFRAIDPIIKEYSAPLLPIAKKQKWDGLVYLHGRLSDNPRRDELDTLVLTSGDFGIAYLLERWAARFVSELLDNFIVCFVGYSANDVIIRYVLDALAADRDMGVHHMPCYAFAGSDIDHKEREVKQWNDKGVIPIMYDSKEGHRLLTETLVNWADCYNSGINGKVQIASACAVTLPQKDPVIGQGLLWALADPSGEPARAFAEHDPKPSIQWLNVLGEKCLDGHDLKWLGITASEVEVEAAQTFSYVDRPAQLSCAGRMALVGEVAGLYAHYDKSMEYISKWAASHVNDKRFLLWVYQNGNALHPAFREDLELALANPEKHISEPMYRAWRLYLDGYMIRPGGTWWQRESLKPWRMGDWLDSVKIHGIDDRQLNDFLTMVRPVVGFQRWLDLSDGVSDAVESFHFEYCLLMSHDLPRFMSLSQDQQETFIKNYETLSFGLIEKVYEVEKLLDKIVAKGRRYVTSWWCRPLDNNSQFVSGGWEQLIFLLKDALIRMAESYSEQAIVIIDKLWHKRSYIARRLALIGASYCQSVGAERFLNMMFGFSMPNSKDMPNLDVQKFWNLHLVNEVECFLGSRAQEFDGRTRLCVENAILSAQDVLPKMNRKLEKSRIDGEMFRRMRVIATDASQLMRPELQELHKRFQKKIDRFKDACMNSRKREYADIPPPPLSPIDLQSWLRACCDEGRVDDVLREWRDFSRSNFVIAVQSAIAVSREDRKNRYSCLRFVVWSLETLVQDCPESDKGRQNLGECHRLSSEDWDFLVEQFPNLSAFVLSKTVELLGDCQTLELCIGYFDRLKRYKKQIHDLPNSELRVKNYGDVISGSQFLGFRCQSLLTSRVLDLWVKTNEKDRYASKEKISNLIRRVLEAALSINELKDFEASLEMLFANFLTVYKLDVEWTRENVLPILQCKEDGRWKVAWKWFLPSPFVTPDMLQDIHDAVIVFMSDTDALKSIKRLNGSAARLVQNIVLPIAENYKKDIGMLLTQLGKVGDLPTLTSQLRFQMEQSQDPARFWCSLLSPLFPDLWPKDVALNTSEVLNDIVAMISMSGTHFADAFDACEIYFFCNKPSNVSGLAMYWQKIKDKDKLAAFLKRIVPEDERHGWPIADFIDSDSSLNIREDMLLLKDNINRNRWQNLRV